MLWLHAQVEKLIVDAIFSGNYKPYTGILAWSRLFYDDTDDKTFRTVYYRWIQNGEVDKVNFDDNKEDVYGFNMEQILGRYRVSGQPPPYVDYMEHDLLVDEDSHGGDWRGDSVLLCLGEHRIGGNPDYRYIIVKIGSKKHKFAGDERTKYLEKRVLEQDADDVRRTLAYVSSQRDAMSAAKEELQSEKLAGEERVRKAKIEAEEMARLVLSVDHRSSLDLGSEFTQAAKALFACSTIGDLPDPVQMNFVAAGPHQSVDVSNAVFTKTDTLWTKMDTAITFKFLPPLQATLTDQQQNVQRDKVRQVMLNWIKYAAVNFHEITGEGIADIQIAFENDGSWSRIGTRSAEPKGKDEATMNFGWVDYRSPVISAKERAVILHEFGHALGMLHEHQSPARGGIQMKNTADVIEFFTTSQKGWTPDMVDQQVISTYNLADVSNFSQVDTKSIMHYPMPACATPDGKDVPFNYDLSELDIAYMTINYPRSIEQEAKRLLQDPGLMTLEAALGRIGLVANDPPVAKHILDLRKQATSSETKYVNPTMIRVVFSDWCKKQHLSRLPQESVGEAAKGKKPTASVEIGHMPGGGSDDTAIRVIPKEPEYGFSKDMNPCQWREANHYTDHFNMKDHLEWLAKPSLQLDHWTSAKEVVIRYMIVYDENEPKTMNGGYIRKPTDFDYGMIKTAFDIWSHNGIKAEAWNSPPTDGSDYLVIVLQDFPGSEDLLKKLTRTSNASYTLQQRSPSVEQQRGLREKAEKALTSLNVSSPEYKKENFVALQPTIPHDMCLRGLVTDEHMERIGNNQDEYSRAFDISIRSIAHQIGHYLGLGHLPDIVTSNSPNPKEDFDVAVGRIQWHPDFSVLDCRSVMWNEFAMSPLESRNDLQRGYLISCFDQALIAFLHPKAFASANGLGDFEKMRTILSMGQEVWEKIKVRINDKAWKLVREYFLEFVQERIESYAKAVKKDGGRLLAQQGYNPKDEKSRGVSERAMGVDDPTASGVPNVKFPSFQRVLWSKLNDLFGPSEGASSFFSLQFPTRFLAKDEFGYELEGSYSNFVKPVSVNEAEFRLTDQLYDAARVVGGPNGKSLSTVYELMLNNLVPKYDPADNEARQGRAKLRAWLLGQSSDQSSFYKNDARLEHQEGSFLPDSAAEEWMLSRPDRFAARNMSRMEVGESLYSDYLAAGKKHRHDRMSKVIEALRAPEKDRRNKLDDVTRYIAAEGAIDTAKLSFKYNDAVVRGNLHVIRDCVSQLDIKSVAEQLQDAKDSLRESALSSITGASRVLPVNMQPLDWSQSLDTDFTPMDLTSDPSVLDMAVQSKVQHVDSLRDQLSALSHHVAGDETVLRKSLDDASDKLSLAQADLAGSYRGSAVLAAKTFIDVKATLAKATTTTGAGLEGIVLKDAKASESEKTRFLSLVQELNPAARVRDLVDAMAKVDDAQRAVQREAARYSQRQTDLILSKSTTTAEQTAQVQRQIDLATQELKDLTARLAVARANKERERQIMNPSTGDQARSSNAGKSGEFTLPSLSEYASVSSHRNGQGGSRWTSVIIDSEEVEKANLDRQTSKTGSFETGVSLFLFSASVKHDSATGQHVVGNKASQFKFKLSMNVTLVTVDRSSWFQPQFFDLSNGFMRNNKEITWSTWPKDFDKDVSKAVKEGIHQGQTFNGPLPCFPTGYILGKDINIEISGFDIANEATHKSVIEQTTASGGFLGFRCTKPNQTTSDETAASVKMAKDGLIIRIPGPQILGYIQQVMPLDQTVPYDSKFALKPSMYLPDDATTADKGKNGAPMGFEPGNETIEEKSKRLADKLRGFDPVRGADGVGRSVEQGGQSKAREVVNGKTAMGSKEASRGLDPTDISSSALERMFSDWMERKVREDPEFIVKFSRKA